MSCRIVRAGFGVAATVWRVEFYDRHGRRLHVGGEGPCTLDGLGP